MFKLLGNIALLCYRLQDVHTNRSSILTNLTIPLKRAFWCSSSLFLLTSLEKRMKNQYSYQNVLEPVSETILDHALKSQVKNMKATNLQGITYHHELHCALLTLDCFQVTHLGSKCWKGSEQNNKEKSYECPLKL